MIGAQRLFLRTVSTTTSSSRSAVAKLSGRAHACSLPHHQSASTASPWSSSSVRSSRRRSLTSSSARPSIAPTSSSSSSSSSSSYHYLSSSFFVCASSISARTLCNGGSHFQQQRRSLPRPRSSSFRLFATAVAAEDNTAPASSSTPPREEENTTMLGHTVDRYGGVIVDHTSLPVTIEGFTSALQAAIDSWMSTGVRGVWLKIPTDRAELVGPAVHAGGFGFHHAEPTYVMLTRWLPEDEENLLPPNASHQVGIGAFILNGKGEVLLVQERRGPAAAASRPDFWKLPTGLVEQAEDIPAAAVREVLEETGVRTDFVSILGIRHGHNIAFGKSDMFFLVALKLADGAEEVDIVIQEQELAAAAWRSLDDMAGNPHIMPGSHMDHMYGLCVEHAAGRYSGMGWQALPMGFNRDGHVVTYSNAPNPEIMGKKQREGGLGAVESAL